MISKLRKFTNDIIWGSKLSNRGLPARILVVVLRYLYAMVRDFFSGQLTMRAMSLVYTTLLSVVPLLAFSFAVLKGFGIFNRLEPFLLNALAPLGEQGRVITLEVLQLVDNVRGSVLGGVGLLFFMYTAISTVQKIEESFNYTWYVSKPRSFSRRFTEYFVVLLVGPLLMVTALGILTSIQSSAVVQFILHNAAMGPVILVAGKLLPYILISGVFTFLYLFMPNAHVNFSAALVGGVAGGVMWAALGAFFANFVLYASTRLEIYAGFAVAITTLIWLYLNWLILLIGAQLAFYFQRPAFLRTGRQEPRLSNAMRERMALSIMYQTGLAFRMPGQSITAQAISEQINIPSIALAPVIAMLEDAGLLFTTEEEELLPGREMTRITIGQILSVVRTRGDTGSHKLPRWATPVNQLGDLLDTAVASAVSGKTLASLLDEGEAPDEGIPAPA